MAEAEPGSEITVASGDGTGQPPHGAADGTARRKALLVLGALGVVYGDIGTSPLYAMRLSAAAAGGDHPASFAILGALSLVFWSLALVVTAKYVFLILRADNNGEGGVLALAALAHRSTGLSRRAKTFIGIIALVGWRCSTATAC
jgi:KUP system potassium uptake protein